MINAKLLQLVVNASNDGVVVAEKEGEDTILIYVNQAFERLTGYSAEEILYQDCRFLQGDDREQEARNMIKQAIAERRPTRQVIRNYRKDGSMFWNELSLTPVFNEADKLTYFIGIQKDVTEQIEANLRAEALEAEIAQLKQRLAALAGQ